MKLPKRKIDKSKHLTDKERGHTFALVFLGILFFISGGAFAAYFYIVSIKVIILIVFFIGGTWCIAFPWGYAGAMEDERSGTV